MAIKYIGMDFEATGSNPWGEHAPIEIGLAVRNDPGEFPAIYQGLIGKWKWTEWEWNEEAAKVHNIPREEIDKAPPAWQADIKAASWLLDQNIGSNRMFNIVVGYNVSGYDRQFITRHFPALDRILSYRTLDLNVLTFALAGDSEKDYLAIKGATKDYAAHKITEALTVTGKHQASPEDTGIKFDWHRGHYDAVAALYSMDYLVARLRGE